MHKRNERSLTKWKWRKAIVHELTPENRDKSYLNYVCIIKVILLGVRFLTFNEKSNKCSYTGNSEINT